MPLWAARSCATRCGIVAIPMAPSYRRLELQSPTWMSVSPQVPNPSRPQTLRDIQPRSTNHIINQAFVGWVSGGVGTFAVQIAKAFGAEVTGVCSTRNVGMVRSIGADHIIDYTEKDFTAGEQRYDLVFDNVGNRSLSECRRVLTPKGVYIASFGQPEHRWLGPLAQLLRMLLMSRFVSQKMTTFTAKESKEDLVVLKELIEAGKVTPVIDRTYPLSEVPEAIRYLEEGHARGKVVITI